MAWGYRRSVKIIPGVRLNFSRSGISTTIGMRGASLNLSNRGSYINVGIPGTGFYNRSKVSHGGREQQVNSRNELIPDIPYDEIISADIQEITSQDMQGIKDTIIVSHEQRNELKIDLKKVKVELFWYRVKLIVSYILIFGLINKSFSQNLKNDIEFQKEVIRQLIVQIENSFVNLDIEFDEFIQTKYENVVNAFRKLILSQKIWDITSTRYEDRKVTRSAAGMTVKRREVKFGVNSIPFIKSKYEALLIRNANGADLYLYPIFLVMFSSKIKFAIIGFDELQFDQSFVSFVESESVPSDTNVLYQTWAKVNRDGSRDKRFKDNYQIPVVQYGEITLKTQTGLNEAFKFSNFGSTEGFGKAFSDYKITLSNLKNIEN